MKIAVIAVTVWMAVVPLVARENPFFPSEEVDLPSITSNAVKSYPPLKRIAITLPEYARVIESISINYKGLDGAIETKTVKLSRSIDWHLPIFLSQSYGDANSPQSVFSPVYKKHSVAFSMIRFLIDGKKIEIKTDDTAIRDFMLVDPNRLVIDFKRDANFLTFKKVLRDSIVTKIHIGNHDGFYRVVIYLDGKYLYRLHKTAGGYRIEII